MLTTFIQNKGSDVWHFHPSCRHFVNYENKAGVKKAERADRPPSGELCDECLGKEKRERQTSDEE